MNIANNFKNIFELISFCFSIQTFKYFPVLPVLITEDLLDYFTNFAHVDESDQHGLLYKFYNNLYKIKYMLSLYIFALLLNFI